MIQGRRGISSVFSLPQPDPCECTLEVFHMLGTFSRMSVKETLQTALVSERAVFLPGRGRGLICPMMVLEKIGNSRSSFGSPVVLKCSSGCLVMLYPQKCCRKCLSP